MTVYCDAVFLLVWVLEVAFNANKRIWKIDCRYLYGEQNLAPCFYVNFSSAFSTHTEYTKHEELVRVRTLQGVESVPQGC